MDRCRFRQGRHSVTGDHTSSRWSSPCQPVAPTTSCSRSLQALCRRQRSTRRTAWVSTEAGWRSAVPELADCLDPPDARHSYAVLRGLTSASGAMVAAATTSLPERAEAGRNYDYRYAWIRDQCYVGEAMAAAGGHELLDDAVRFVSARLLEHGDRLAPAYTSVGGVVPDQRNLGLRGYPGGTDIIGNWVNKQFQLDVFGESLLLLAAAARLDRIDTEGWRAAKVAADADCLPDGRSRTPGSGRSTTSRGRTAGSSVPPACARWRPPIRAAAMRSTGSAWPTRIVADTSAHAIDREAGNWQRTPDDPRLDAALLLPGLRGAVPADDPGRSPPWPPTPATLRTRASRTASSKTSDHWARPRVRSSSAGS